MDDLKEMKNRESYATWKITFSKPCLNWQYVIRDKERKPLINW